MDFHIFTVVLLLGAFVMNMITITKLKKAITKWQAAVELWQDTARIKQEHIDTLVKRLESRT